MVFVHHTPPDKAKANQYLPDLYGTYLPNLMSAQELRASLDRDGFVIIPALLSTDEELDRYRHACQRTVQQARSGQWPFVRTLPKQFPPWNAADATQQGIWGVRRD